MTTTSPPFFRKNSDDTKLNSSSLPPYSKRVLVAVIVAIPMALGLNISLNSMISFMPVWGIIMINVIIIISYMEFILPRISKLLSS